MSRYSSKDQKGDGARDRTGDKAKMAEVQEKDKARDLLLDDLLKKLPGPVVWGQHAPSTQFSGVTWELLFISISKLNVTDVF